ncbi:UNVERIFIED_CONTAM: hypothetical protein HDU68_004868 [Siphonaria sp. JEL0065]|nr:hypothetical protein HDU68_004868 [Siphonaria sp. JEL0065]
MYASNVIAGPFRGTPACELGLSRISNSLRTKIFTLTSLVAECPFCTAFNCGVGKPKPIKLMPTDLSEKERAALNVVSSATAIPAARSERMRNAVVKHYGESGLQQIGLLCGFMSLWNTVNELLCVDIDPSVTEYASIVLQGTGWNTDKRKTAPVIPPSKQKPTKPSHPSALTALKHAVKISKSNTTLLKEFPSYVTGLNDWALKHFGFIPRYLLSMISLESRRVFCYNLSISLFAGSDTPAHLPFPYGLTVREKIILGFIFFTSIPNYYLASHFAKLAADRKIPTTALLEALKQSKSKTQDVQDFMSIVRLLTSKIAVRDSEHYDISPLLLPVSNNNARVVLEVVTVLGSFALMHRYSAVWDDEMGLEPEVKDVVKGFYGKEIGLGDCDYSANCSDGTSRNVTGIGGASGMSYQHTPAKEGQLWGGGVKY